MKVDDDHPETADLYRALDQFRNTCLGQLKSAFLPADDPRAGGVWTADRANELIHRFVENPDESNRAFIDKLQDQLSDASTEAVQLLVELTWLHVVMSNPEKQGYASKRQLLDDIAAIGEAAGPSDIFDEVLHTGFVNPGTSFFTRRPNQLWLLIRFTALWTAASGESRAKWLSDPWAFREMVFGLDGVADQTQRHALLYLIHPDTFEACVSQYDKRDIAKLANEDEVADNDDRTIANVRRRLTEEFGRGFNFYSADVKALWRPQPAAPDQPETSDPVDDERDAWFIRGQGGDLVPTWLERGICTVDFFDAFPFAIERGKSREQLRKQAEDTGVDITTGGFSNELGQVWRFVNQMAVGDYVVTVSGQDVYLGTVESEPRNVVTKTQRQTVRDVEWLNANRPMQRREISSSLSSRMKTLLTLSRITEEIGELERWVSEGDDTTAPPPPVAQAVTLPRATADLERDLLLPAPWLNRVIDLLEEKRQVVLYGPPGTGKTFLAQALADHFSDHGGTSELVQFHPSYTYEDFFEGFRPVAGSDGGVQYEIKPGPLRRIADAAAKDSASPFILIVDEINRANLAKVFGELYFLLEYRDRTITLQYSTEEFQFPPNLYVIGTMNTADRSIALVDAAMRRRFYFVELAPSAEPVDGLLGRWLRDRGMDDTPSRLLAELNRRLGDPDAAVGPSYLMSEEIGKPGRLEMIWEHAILPLLAEQFYGTGQNLQEFSLAAIEAAVASADS